MNEPKHLPQTTRQELLLCLFVFFLYLKLHSLVVLGASSCIQHPRCLIVIPPLVKSSPRLPQVLHSRATCWQPGYTVSLRGPAVPEGRVCSGPEIPRALLMEHQQLSVGPALRQPL